MPDGQYTAAVYGLIRAGRCGEAWGGRGGSEPGCGALRGGVGPVLSLRTDRGATPGTASFPRAASHPAALPPAARRRPPPSRHFPVLAL